MKDSWPMHASDMLVYTLCLESVWNGPIHKLISIKLLHGYVVSCEFCECGNHAGRGGLMFAGIYANEEF